MANRWLVQTSIVACCALGACATNIGSSNNAALQDTGGETLTQQVLSDPKRISSLKSASERSSPPAVSGDPFNGDFSGPPKLRAYLQGLLSRVTKAGRLPVPPMSLNVRDCAPFQDDSDYERGIHLCFTTIGSMSSESELAFLIGHEACHQILGHSSEIEVRKGEYWKSWLTGYMLTGPFGSPFFETNGQNSAAEMRRNQELEADRCAFDLISASGFNVSGGIAFLDLLSQAELNRTSNAKAIASYDADRNERIKGRLNEFGPIMKTIGYALLTVSIIDPHSPGRLYRAHRLDDNTHPGGEERIKHARNYVGLHHRAAGGREAGLLPWTRAEAAEYAEVAEFFSELRESNDVAVRLYQMAPHEVRYSVPADRSVRSQDSNVGEYRQLHARIEKVLRGSLNLHPRSRARMAYIEAKIGRLDRVRGQLAELTQKSFSGFSAYVLWGLTYSFGDLDYSKKVIRDGIRELKATYPNGLDSVVSMDIAALLQELGDSSAAREIENECRRDADRVLAKDKATSKIITFKNDVDTRQMAIDVACGIEYAGQRLARQYPGNLSVTHSFARKYSLNILG